MTGTKPRSRSSSSAKPTNYRCLLRGAGRLEEKGETEQAGREIDTLRQAQQTRKSDKALERRLWEVQGRHLCQKGDGEAGLKLLKKLVDATKNDFPHHAWGNGAVYMESWVIAALEAGNATEAEEAFQEALAHDAGSVRGALGLWALCERLGRTEETTAT